MRFWGSLAAGAVAVAVALVGCGEPRLIGRSCGRQGCEPDVLALPAPLGCGVQIDLPADDVKPGVGRQRCHLFTLDLLDAPEGDGRVYLTRIEVASGPHAHDLDLRLAPELAAFDDGPVDCAELAERAVPWLPLMTAHTTRSDWDFAPAPLRASQTHRLLINDAFTNQTEETVGVSVRVNLHCADRLPERVSQTFEFTSREARLVTPGERWTTASSPCAFSKEVVVSRLYRRTRFITRFVVRRLGETELLWQSDFDWIRELDPPLAVARDEGFAWECVYENRTDLPFQIGGNATDACSLLGIYRLPGGGADAVPERCTR